MDGISHYFNLVEDKIIDLTSIQFNHEIDYKDYQIINGKVLPSGVVLQKLFDIIDRNIFETTFLESVKCYPLERKNLKTCSRNCKSIMLEQLKILNPKLIITLGEFPTRNLLNFKFNKFADVVGNIYEVNGYKILPIYHPSPISPKSYKGNITDI